MSIRNKILLVIVCTALPLLFLCYFISSTIITKNFETVEYNSTQQNLDRLYDALQSRITRIADELPSWGTWDDTYQFMIDHNDAYKKSNVVYASTIQPMKLNMLFWIDLNARIVANLHMDYMTGKTIPVPDSLLPYLEKNSRLLTHPSLDKVNSGIIMLDDKPLLIASQPILTSAGKGPSHGSLIFARYLDTQMIRELATETHEKISLYPYTDNVLPNDFVDAKSHLQSIGNFYIYPLSKNTIVGYRIFPDMFGKPALIIKVILPRPVYLQAQKSIYIFTILFAMTAIVFAIIMVVLLERIVVARIVALQKALIEIEKSDAMNAYISVKGEDEISSLGHSMNSMLEALHEASAGQKKGEEEFRNVADSAPIFIWITNEQSKCTYINKTWIDFTQKKITEELGDGWMDDIHPEDKQAYLAGYTNAFKNHIPYTKEVRIKRADGQYRWIITHVIPNFTKNAKFVGCLGVGNDITEIKEASLSMQKINQVFVDREIQMSELKKENQRLQKENELAKNIQ